MNKFNNNKEKNKQSFFLSKYLSFFLKLFSKNKLSTKKVKKKDDPNPNIYTFW